MASVFSITPDAGGGGVSFVAVVSQFDGITGNYWDIVEPNEPRYDMEDIKAGGVDGIAEGLAGFRGRRIYAEVITIAFSQSSCKAVKASVDAIFNQACAVVIPNDTTAYPACYLVATKVIEQAFDTGLGTFFERFSIELDQKRLA